MKTIYKIQFGNSYQRQKEGWTVHTGIYENPFLCWLDSPGESAGIGIEDALLEGYAMGSLPTRFWLGLPDGAYRLKFTFFEQNKDHGPFDIEANGKTIASGLVAHANTLLEKTADVCAVDGKIELLFKPAEGADFVVNGLQVWAESAVEPIPLFPDAPVKFKNDAGAFNGLETTSPEEALRGICDWLLGVQHENGYIGDAYGWRSLTDIYYMWYSCSMAVRALHGGYALFGEKRWLDAAERCMDLFVSRQLPNGAFCGHVTGKPTCEMPPQEVENVMAKARQPMSDIGSVVGALAIMAGSEYVDAGRRAKYAASVGDFCAKWASRFQYPDGSWSDGPGLRNLNVYSCATAIEAGTHALAAEVTGNGEFRRAADRAMEYFLKDWQADGRILGRSPHWPVHSGLPFVLEIEYFGDCWYYDDGAITTSIYTKDADLAARIRAAVRNRVYGSKGLLTLLPPGAIWWPLQNVWLNAKSCGMVQDLMFVRRECGGGPELDPIVGTMIRVLSTPKLAEYIGVRAEMPENPYGMGANQSWIGMRVEATGFAGMTLAEYLRPGIIYGRKTTIGGTAK